MSNVITPQDCGKVKYIQMPRIELKKIGDRRSASIDRSWNSSSIESYYAKYNFDYDSYMDLIFFKLERSMDYLSDENITVGTHFRREDFDPLLRYCCDEDIKLWEHPHICKMMDDLLDSFIQEARKKGIILFTSDKPNIMRGGCGLLKNTDQIIGTFDVVEFTLGELENEIKVHGVKKFSQALVPVTEFVYANVETVDGVKRQFKYVFIRPRASRVLVGDETSLTSELDNVSYEFVNDAEMKTILYFYNYSPIPSNPLVNRFKSLTEDEGALSAVGDKKLSSERMASRFAMLEG